MSAPAEATQESLTITERQNWLCELPPWIVGVASLGAKGTGKSFEMCLMALSHCEAYGEKARCLILRRYGNELEPIKDMMLGILAATYGGERAAKMYNKSLGTFHPPTSGMIKFTGCENTKDAVKIRGGNWNFLGIDEMPRFPSEDLISTVRQELRGTEGVATRIFYTGNPGGELNQVVRATITNQNPFEPFTEPGTGLTWIYAPSRPTDNPFLNREEHDAQIEATAKHDPDLAKALQTGDFDLITTGDFFGNCWSPKRSVIAPLVEIPPTGGSVKIAIDHGGGSAPTSGLYFFLAETGLHMWSGDFMPRGSLIIFDEHDDAMSDNLQRTLGWSISENCAAMDRIAANWEMRSSAIIDPQVFQDHGGKTRLAEEYEANGIRPLDPWRKTRREQKAALIRELMHGAQPPGSREKAGLYITSNCKHTLATVPLLPTDRTRRDCPSTDGADHWYDALCGAALYKRERFSRTELIR